MERDRMGWGPHGVGTARGGDRTGWDAHPDLPTLFGSPTLAVVPGAVLAGSSCPSCTLSPTHARTKALALVPSYS